MNPNRFDRISRRIAERRLSRRQALAAGGVGVTSLAVGLVPATAQENDATPAATPEVVPAEPWTGEKVTYLFVQSFHSGSITPTEGSDGRYTVTLEQGSGQTIYFADRPSRDVGATDTAQFLEGLGFPEDNPPNAALIVETAPGETDVAVVELFNPIYDPTTQGVTYDVEVLENWQEDLELGFREAPADLATLAPDFGAAHLLIDDCPTDAHVLCRRYDGIGRSNPDEGRFENVDTCWNYAVCMPCEPYGHVQPSRCATQEYWVDKCNRTFDGCEGRCVALFSWPFANCL